MHVIIHKSHAKCALVTTTFSSLVLRVLCIIQRTKRDKGKVHARCARPQQRPVSRRVVISPNSISFHRRWCASVQLNQRKRIWHQRKHCRAVWLMDQRHLRICANGIRDVAASLCKRTTGNAQDDRAGVRRVLDRDAQRLVCRQPRFRDGCRGSQASRNPCGKMHRHLPRLASLRGDISPHPKTRRHLSLHRSARRRMRTRQNFPSPQRQI